MLRCTVPMSTTPRPFATSGYGSPRPHGLHPRWPSCGQRPRWWLRDPWPQHHPLPCLSGAPSLAAASPWVLPFCALCAPTPYSARAVRAPLLPPCTGIGRGVFPLGESFRVPSVSGRLELPTSLVPRSQQLAVPALAALGPMVADPTALAVKSHWALFGGADNRRPGLAVARLALEGNVLAKAARGSRVWAR